MDKQEEMILLFIFVVAIVVEMFYITPIVLTNASTEIVLDKIFTAGIMLSMLIILAMVLLRQKHLDEMFMNFGIKKHRKTANDIKKELSALYGDLGALKIVLKDGFLERKEYDKKKKLIEAKIKKKREELENLDKKSKQTKK
jgi:hypothetical protein